LGATFTTLVCAGRTAARDTQDVVENIRVIPKIIISNFIVFGVYYKTYQAKKGLI
tara:strand:- start:702 stop:866 length:165 start_codon:yes stop_codon:yes gene_type:complete